MPRLAMTEHTRFAVCIKNSGYAASLELRKLYQVVEDADAEKDDMIRIIDESGEDYLYSADRFIFAPRISIVDDGHLHHCPQFPPSMVEASAVQTWRNASAMVGLTTLGAPMLLLRTDSRSMRR